MLMPPRLWKNLCTAVLASAVASVPLAAGAAPAAAGVVKPFEKVYDDAVYGDFITGGNTALGCDGSPDEAVCIEAASGASNTNNNSIDMRQLDRAGLSTASFNSTSGEYEIPPGSKIVHAQLMWGGNTGTYGTNSRLACDLASPSTPPAAPGPEGAAPILRVAGGAESPVPIDEFTRDPVAAGPHYYTARSDVTDLFAGAPDGTPFRVDVADVWAPEGKGCVGGWSLTIVYGYDAPNAQYAPERRAVDLYYGHVTQRSSDAPTNVQICGFYRAGDATPHASTSILEGDRGVSGDKFRVNGQAIVDEKTGSANNFFNSVADYALDPAYDNTLGLDAKGFDLPADAIPAGSECAELTFETNGDTYVPFQVALSVPVPDLKYTKTAAPLSVKPGDTITYTVEIENIGDLDYPNAKFSDDLSEVNDDAVYQNDITADTGTADYTAPRLRWTGDLAAGEKAVITYSAKVNDPVSGNGELGNRVTVDGAQNERTNCEADSTDPACEPTPVVDVPKADLRIVKRLRSAETVRPGDRFVYLLRVTNQGPDEAENITVTDKLPKAISFVRSKEGCTESAGAVTCEAASLAAGESRTWTIRVRLDKDYQGSGMDLGNTAKVSSTTKDPKLRNNTSQEVFPPLSDK